jgi:DNA-binding CsgD family transcriptional regulator
LSLHNRDGDTELVTIHLPLIAEAGVTLAEFGATAKAIGRPEFFPCLIQGLQQMLPFRNSDMVIGDLHRYQRPPELVGVFGDETYTSVIRELYLPSGYQLCPEMTAIHSGLHNGIFSMAEFGADNFLASECYAAYYGALEIRNFYDLFCDLGDGRVVGWSVCRHLGEPDFTTAEDRRLRWLAPLLVGLVARHCQLAFPARVHLATGTRSALPSEITAALSRLASEPLTRRELEVALLLIRGFSTKAVSRQLHIAPATEAVHRRNIFRKLRMASQVELVSYCLGEFRDRAPIPH